MSSFTALTRMIGSLVARHCGCLRPEDTSTCVCLLDGDTGREWTELFEESRRQAVMALLYDAILTMPKDRRPPRSVLFHLMSMMQTIERDNRHREEALVAFHNEVMLPLGLPTVVVKGSSLARLYPNPLHREYGDNDLYTGTDTERLCRHLESVGVAVDRKDPRHAAFSFHGTDFEAHSYLLYHGDDPQWGAVPLESGGLAIRHLPAEEEAFFLAKHIEHHAVFFNTPVRLRDLADWSMLLCSDGFDMGSFRELKRGSDVDRFAELLSMTCNSLFGLDIDCRPPQGFDADDFEAMYMHCPERHRLALVRVVRRSWKYIRHGRKYRSIYGQSMFRRFYLRNIWVAIRNGIGNSCAGTRKR